VEWSWRWISEVLGKTCPCPTLFTRNPTWIDTGLNSDLRSDSQPNNRLSHGAATRLDKREYLKRNIIICTLCQLLLEWLNGRWDKHVEGMEQIKSYNI
jgi:hypothetical protein